MSPHPLSTKERILQSAGNIFGQEGFKDATIRRIAADANVNIAAINYHFGDKEGLYGAVLEDVFQIGFTRFPATLVDEKDSPPEQRLRTFIRAMILRLLSTKGWGGIGGHGQLIARELLNPSPALEPILEKYIEPHKNLLLSLIVEIMAVDPGPQKLMPCAISIIGQCIYYGLASKLIGRVSREIAPREENLELLADFVWQFSLGGITRIKEELLTPPEDRS